ncbi:MAG: Gfo/Idh/MocA family protein [Chthonomonadales bacterium]
MKQDSNWVVVGYGMGAYHARLISGTQGLNLFGICDTDSHKRERAKAEYPDAKIYSDFAQVLTDPKADGVVIVTPHNLHAPMAIQAMDAGKHVVTDKAMCLSVDEARRMIQARDRNGVLLSTFHNRRWDGDFLTVRRILEDGLIGDLYHIQSCVTGWGTPGGWRSDRTQMGGWLYDWGAHTLDQILLLARSQPVRVYAFAHHRPAGSSSVEDYIHCTVTFASGLTAVTVIGYLNRIPMERWYVMGTRGTLACSGFDGPVRLNTDLGSVTGEIAVPLLKGDWASFYQNIAAFLAGDEELQVRPEELIPQIAIAEAAYQSIASGTAVTLAI